MNRSSTGNRKPRFSQFLKILREPRSLFYILSTLGTFVFILLSFSFGRPAYEWMVQENLPGIRFTDYFLHLFHAAAHRTNLYEQVLYPQLGCFPPLAYLMYLFLYHLAPAQSEAMEYFEHMEQIPGTLHVFTFYLIFSALLLFIGISKTGRRSTRRDAGIFTLLMSSAIFAGSGYMVGNSTMLVLALLLIAFRLKERPSPFAREAALWLFAICVGFKLYPAVFGLIYLKEKRYRELSRLILYCLAAVFLPFIFFGGLEGLIAWAKNIVHTMTSLRQDDFGRPQYLKGMLFTVLKLVTGQELLPLATVLTWLICAFWAFLAWRSESPLRTQFFLICIMVFFPTNAFRYTLAYLSIPLISYLKAAPEKEKRSKSAFLLTGLYGLLYSVPVWWIAVDGLEKRYEYYSLTSVEIALYLVAYALILTVTVLELRARKSSARVSGSTV